MPELAEWQFPRGGGLQVYQLPEHAGQGSFTLAVATLPHGLKNLGLVWGRVLVHCVRNLRYPARWRRLYKCDTDTPARRT